MKDQTFRILIASAVLFLLSGIGYIAYRDFKNTDRCRQLYGSTATWGGKDLCSNEVGRLK